VLQELGADDGVVRDRLEQVSRVHVGDVEPDLGHCRPSPLDPLHAEVEAHVVGAPPLFADERGELSWTAPDLEPLRRIDPIHPVDDDGPPTGPATAHPTRQGLRSNPGPWHGVVRTYETQADGVWFRMVR
jgi:hypothetical protein